MYSYILITPVRDEEDALPYLYDCVINQSILPVVWVIVNDSSIDNTKEIIKKFKDQNSWIYSIDIASNVERRFDKHFPYICRLGISHAQEICRMSNLNYEYIIKCDADILMNNFVISNLLKEFEQDKTLGIASPRMPYISRADFLNNEYIIVNGFFQVEPTDGIRVYRRTCYEGLGGLPLETGGDDIILAKGKISGWKVSCLSNVVAYLSRKTNITTGGLWNGLKFKGYRRYYLDYNLLLVFLTCLYESFRSPYYGGMAIAYGYILSSIKKDRKIEDVDIRFYYNKIRPKEVLNTYLDNILQSINRIC